MWNQFSEEVAREREIVRTMKTPPRVGTYKSQALRELARRLELEETVEQLRRQTDDLLSEVESLRDTNLPPVQIKETTEIINGLPYNT